MKLNFLLTAAALTAPIFANGQVSAPGELASDRAREFWCFKAPVAASRPPIRRQQWPRKAIDHFILARLEKSGLVPSPEADRRTIIRRLCFDLTGLPPTPEEIASFLADTREDAYERLVERLIASPRFGERLASMWLPLARYAEDQAHQVGSDTKFFYPNAYKYRDWVIAAFNRDLPYDRFVKLQLAADRYLNVQATAAPEATEEGDEDKEPTKPQAPNRPTAAVPADLAALGFLGLGPKYYNRGRLEVMADEWEDRVDTVSRTFLGLTVACARCHDHKFEPITQKDYYALAGIFAGTKMINRMPDGSAEKPTVLAEKMDTGTLHVVEDGSPTDLNVFLRGSVENKGPVAPRRFLEVLAPSEPALFKDGSGRKELAEAVADRGNPLTSRVIVNRMWGLYFGRPLVDTPSNLGRSGSIPSHPELLDDLAVRFMDNGWSLKWLTRELVLSSTYRQSSRTTGRRRSAASQGPKQVSLPPAWSDPANLLLGRMNRRRLSAEQWRDAALYVSGRLAWDSTRSAELSEPANQRRTVYARVSRLKLDDFLTLFDYPDANVHAEKRAVTTTATQKLFMLNSPFVATQASALATRLAANPEENDAARVKKAYLLLFGREPESAELNVALQFLSRTGPGAMSRWEQYAQILLISNEMLYLD